jgi:hypothetical protein
MKRYWDKVNDEWIYEDEQDTRDVRREEAPRSLRGDHEPDRNNLVLLISSLNHKAREE